MKGRYKFLTDENLARSVSRALQEAGEDVESMIDRFGRGAKDEVWLPDAGKHRLIVLTKDDAQKRKPQELALLLEHRVLHFAFAPNHVFTIDEQKAAILVALPDIKGIVDLKSSANGVMVRIGPDGKLTRRRSEEIG